jgi:hypothetical protein
VEEHQLHEHDSSTRQPIWLSTWSQ